MTDRNHEAQIISPQSIASTATYLPQHIYETMGAEILTTGHSNAQLKRNDSEGGWVVQKFGGTSVGKLPVNIAEDIVR